MVYRMAVALLALFPVGCAPPMPESAETSTAPARPGCAMLSPYGAAMPAFGPFGYAMSSSIRALQTLNGCPPATSLSAEAARTPPAPAPELKNLLAQKNSCTEAVRSRPAFARVAGHFSDVTTGNFSMVQLSDDARPTAAEAHLVAEYYDSSLPCIQALASAFAKLAPADAPILDRSIADQQAVVAELASRRISWGEFARQSQKISAQAATKFQTAGL